MDGPAPAGPPRRGGLPLRLEHHRALDGLRGVAVAAVLAYHGGFAWMRGGYLGVSAFFTLSGFLITRLLLAEYRAEGRVDLGRFWARRVRRLLPAALVALAGIVVFGATVASPEQLAALRGDVVAALGYGANWRFVLAETSYADLSALPSPVQHFWSLAIEEQFYLVFPLAVVGLLRAGRGRLAPVFGVLAASTLASVAASAWLATAGPRGGTDRAYFGTDTRAAELLVGALLAVVLAGNGRRRRHRAPRRLLAGLGGAVLGGAVLGGAGLGALTVLALAWSRLPSASPGLYRGGLALHALAVAMVIYAALRPGPVRSLLAAAPLRGLGRVSYGVYLYHWPIFLWLTPQRSGLDTGPLFALRATATVVAAALSYTLIERPIRERRALRRPTRPAWAGRLASPAAAAVAAAAVVVVAATVVTASPPRPTIDFDAARSSLASPLRPPPPGGPGTDGPKAHGVPVVAGFGDSTALMASEALRRWSAPSSALSVVDGSTVLGCGLPHGGPRRHGDSVEETTQECETRTLGWAALSRRLAVDIAVVQFGPWEIVEHQLPGDDRWRSPGDPVFDQWLRREITAAGAALAAGGATVVWLTAPELGAASWLERDGVDHRDGIARFNEIVLEVARRPPGLRVVDLAAYVASRPDGVEDRELRPDGVHFSRDSATTVGRWLGPAVLEAAEAAPGSVIGP